MQTSKIHFICLLLVHLPLSKQWSALKCARKAQKWNMLVYMHSHTCSKQTHANYSECKATVLKKAIWLNYYYHPATNGKHFYLFPFSLISKILSKLSCLPRPWFDHYHIKISTAEVWSIGICEYLSATGQNKVYKNVKQSILYLISTKVTFVSIFSQI